MCGNQVSDLSPLSNNANLNCIAFIANSIEDISPLAGLLNLVVVELSENKITDLSPLVKNADGGGIGSTSGDYIIMIRDNPLTDDAMFEQSPYLEKKGIEMYIEIEDT